MNRTVRDMTKELGTNKNVIYRIIERQSLEPVPKIRPQDPQRYSDESFQIISDEYSRLQEKHGHDTPKRSSGSKTTDLISVLEKQINQYEKEIERLNKIIESKDEYIKDLTEKNHIETVRYQEILAREQTTKLLTAQSQVRFNLFKPSTWKRKTDTPDLEPLTKDESDSQV